MWTPVEDKVLVDCLVSLKVDHKFIADNGFKSGFANALQSMMEEKLPGCGIKACPHITSRIKTLKKLWQTAHDMVYGTNTSGFGWDPDTKCVTADKEVWDEYIKEAYGYNQKVFSEGGSKYKMKEDYNEYEGAAKWKRQNEAKEAKNRKRAERKNVTATTSKKRKGHMEVDGDSSSESSGTQKRQKVEAKKQGKAKVVVSDSSGGNDRGWKPSDSDHGSSEGNEEEDHIVREDKRRAKLYKKLKKVHRRPNMVPEAKADFNQSTLEDYDVRKSGSQGVKGVKCKAETSNSFAKVDLHMWVKMELRSWENFWPSFG
ncbi:hypothetical protein K1719_020857 [Acacia pycnantha]|nr:hypothetical protein K1719_020857 [Acacia pycnantha]